MYLCSEAESAAGESHKNDNPRHLEAARLSEEYRRIPLGAKGVEKP